MYGDNSQVNEVENKVIWAQDRMVWTYDDLFEGNC